MQKRLALAVLTLVLATPAGAARVVLRGVAQSDRGPYVTLVAHLHDTGPSSIAGRVRCLPGSIPCLFGRAHLEASVNAYGTLAGSVANARVYCAIYGTFDTTGVAGRYACQRSDGAADQGAFALVP